MLRDLLDEFKVSIESLKFVVYAIYAAISRYQFMYAMNIPLPTGPFMILLLPQPCILLVIIPLFYTSSVLLKT